tara:strand:- start:1313 stop:1477 length:165 start_codon:yes stop_codon:yes gene_type:complete
MEWVYFAVGLLVGMIVQTVLIKWVSSGNMVVTHKHVRDEVQKDERELTDNFSEV